MKKREESINLFDISVFQRSILILMGNTHLLIYFYVEREREREALLIVPAAEKISSLQFHNRQFCRLRLRMVMHFKYCGSRLGGTTDM
jgi:hypothetical protein